MAAKPPDNGATQNLKKKSENLMERAPHRPYICEVEA